MAYFLLHFEGTDASEVPWGPRTRHHQHASAALSGLAMAERGKRDGGRFPREKYRDFGGLILGVANICG